MIEEDTYPQLISEILKHIEYIKSLETGASLIDIIYDFCFKNNIDLEMVGDAISSDVYFKSFIQKDCELHRIFKTDQEALDEW